MKIGDTLAGRYELRTRIGGGGLGEVFRGLDSRTGREVMIKIFDAARCPTAALLQYQARLTEAMGVSHPAVVLPRVQVGLLNKPPFVASESLDGQDLAGVAREGPVPWMRAVEIVTGCADALAAIAAEIDASHRAIKPGNVWICPDGQVRLLDVGVAELGVQSVPLRANGSAVEYRAPEQIEGQPGDARSDVFSLGVLLFELVTGVHPFAGESSVEAATAARAPSAPKASSVASVPLPPTVEALLARMLSRDPDDRPVDAAALGKEFVAVKRAAEPAARAPTPTPAAPAKPAPMDDPTTALSVPVMRRARAAPPAVAPTAPPVAEPSPVEAASPDEPPIMAIAPETPAPAQAPESRPKEPWLAAPAAPVESSARFPPTNPRRVPRPRPVPRNFVPDEPTEFAPRPQTRAYTPDEGTEALPPSSLRRPVSDEPTEALPSVQPELSLQVVRQPVVVSATHIPDGRTEVLAAASPRRPLERPSARPRVGIVSPAHQEDGQTEVLLTPASHAASPNAHRPDPTPAPVSDESTQILSGLHRVGLPSKAAGQSPTMAAKTDASGTSRIAVYGGLVVAAIVIVVIAWVFTRL